MPKTASCSRRSKVLDSKRVGPARKRYDEEDRREPEKDDEVAPPSISDLRGSALLGVRSPTPCSISAGPYTCHSNAGAGVHDASFAGAASGRGDRVRLRTSVIQKCRTHRPEPSRRSRSDQSARAFGLTGTGPFAHCRIFESGWSAAMLLTSLVEIRQ